MLVRTRLISALPVQVVLPLLFATNGLFLGMWIASIPEVTGRLNLTHGELGTALSAFPLGGLVAFPLAAVLMNRLSSRATILGFGLLRALTFPFLATATSDVNLAIVLAIVGFAHGGLDVSLNAQGVDVERHTGGAILSRCHAAYSVGTLSGSLGAGLLEQIGFDVVPLFLIPTLLGGAIFALSRHKLVEAKRPATPVATRAGGGSGWRGLNVLPYALGIVLAIAFVTEIADEAICDWFSIYLREDIQSLPAAAALDYSVFAFAILLGRIFGDGISNHVPPLRILQVSGAVAGVGMIIGVSVNTTAGMMVGTAIAGLGYSLILPTIYRLAGSIPNFPESAALAAVATAVYLGYLVGPLVIGPVSNATSLRFALAGVGVLFFLVPVLGRMGEASSGRLTPAPAYAAASGQDRTSRDG